MWSFEGSGESLTELVERCWFVRSVKWGSIFVEKFFSVLFWCVNLQVGIWSMLFYAKNFRWIFWDFFYTFMLSNLSLV
jgi:hypothetical protein